MRLVSFSLGCLNKEGEVSMVGYSLGCVVCSMLDLAWSMVSSRIGEVDGYMLRRDNLAIHLALNFWYIMKKKSFRGVLGSIGLGQKASKEKLPLEENGLKPLWCMVNISLPCGNFKHLWTTKGMAFIERSQGWHSCIQNWSDYGMIENVTSKVLGPTCNGSTINPILGHVKPLCFLIHAVGLL